MYKRQEYDKLIAKLWDEYNMTRSDALAQAKPIEDEQRWQNRLTDVYKRQGVGHRRGTCRL